MTSPATTATYPLSLHDALPIYVQNDADVHALVAAVIARYGAIDILINNAGITMGGDIRLFSDRKSTRLNSSHRCISYAVFCLKKKKHNTHMSRTRPHLPKHRNA